MAALEAVFVPDADGWYRAFKSWNGMTGRYMYKLTLETTARAVKEAPGPGKPPRNRTGINYSTGRLQSMIRPQRGHYGSDRDLEGRVVAIPKHAKWVHGGTQPHTITPKRADALVFYWHKKGKVVAFKSVRHPGTAANPFLERALKKAV